MNWKLLNSCIFSAEVYGKLSLGHITFMLKRSIYCIFWLLYIYKVNLDDVSVASL